MKQLDELISIIHRLLGPGGCPWDQEQTLHSVREMLLEETCEVIDAVNLNENGKIEEELGDLLFVVLFCCALGEKEKRFDLKSVLKEITGKLIRRHPHVFGDTSIENSEAVVVQWEKIKKDEKAHADRKSALDGIPLALPALARGQKMLKKMKKAHYPLSSLTPQAEISEKSLGDALLHLIAQAQEAGIDAEVSLRKALAEKEKNFRDWEDKKG